MSGVVVLNWEELIAQLPSGGGSNPGTGGGITVNCPNLQVLHEIKDLVQKLKDGLLLPSSIQKIKGKTLPVPAVVGEYTLPFVFDKDILITGTMFGQSAWKYEDNWDLEIEGGIQLFESVYTKELNEHKHFNVFYPVPANTPINMVLHNVSGNSRQVWFDIEYLELGQAVEPPNPNPNPDPPAEEFDDVNLVLYLDATGSMIEHYKDTGKLKPVLLTFADKLQEYCQKRKISHRVSLVWFGDNRFNTNYKEIAFEGGNAVGIKTVLENVPVLESYTDLEETGLAVITETLENFDSKKTIGSMTRVLWITDIFDADFSSGEEPLFENIRNVAITKGIKISYVGSGNYKNTFAKEENSKYFQFIADFNQDDLSILYAEETLEKVLG